MNGFDLMDGRSKGGKERGREKRREGCISVGGWWMDEWEERRNAVSADLKPKNMILQFSNYW